MAVSFAGLVLNTGNMVNRLCTKKLPKAGKVISEGCNSRSLSLLDIPRLTGYLNFVFTVLCLATTYFGRHYNMELHFPPQAVKYNKRRISGEAHKDPAWWSEALRHPPERSIATRSRELLITWSNATTTPGLGGYYLGKSQVDAEPYSAFAIPIPLSLCRGKEDINT